MSRWHHPSCDAPSVSVQAGLPYCKSCGESPDINNLVTDQENANPPWTIPPDEKPGEFRLRWPASVVRNSPTEVRTETSTTTTNERSNASSYAHGSATQEHPFYKRRLTGTEFRILSISPAIDESHPIHGVLGNYRIDGYPEYETVSYCWGGEDGDARQNRPVYIGEYWDILLQTKNCWSMLQYIRLGSHSRFIWVDAICINQNDLHEKEYQVPLMGQIYGNCLRTIIYLGEDIVKPKNLSLTKRRVYPGRTDLTEFENVIPKSVMNLEQLFNLRYFQRVWVIQEAILAPLAVIPAHGYEFRVRARATSNDLNHPWMEYACTGSLSKSLSSLLQQTRYSIATDTRDKVYGILGLGLQVTGFRPDYSISRLHTYIGTILHLLFVEQCTLVLTGAGNHQPDTKFPSWLPDWSLEDMGKRLLPLSRANSNFGHIAGSRLEERHFGKQIAYLDEDFFSLFNSADDAVAPMYFTTSKLWAIRSPFVDPATLKLTLPLIHVCKFSSALVEVGWIKNFNHRVFQEPCHVFSLEVAGFKMYVCVSDTTDQLSVEAGDNELFLLQKTREVTLVLFMRRLPENGEYRLLRCVICYDLFLSRNPSTRLPLEKFPVHIDPLYCGHKKAGSSLLYETVTVFQNAIPYLIGKDRTKSQELPATVRTRDKRNVDRYISNCIANLFEQISPNSATSLVDSYVAFLLVFCPGCAAWNEQGMAYMKVSPEELIESCRALYFDPFKLKLEVCVPFEAELDGSGRWEWAQLGTEPIQTATGYEGDLLGRVMRMRISVDILHKCLRGSWYQEAQTCNRILQNAEPILGSAGPWNTSDAFCYYPWPESFYEEGQIPGRVCQVTIV